MNKKIKVFFTVSAMSLVCSMFSGMAHAQSFDYGSFEAMFGEPVTTSATGSPQRVSEVPVDMTIITADQIKRSGETNLARVLNRVAGIGVTEWASEAQDVTFKGYGSKLLVLVNGRQVYMDHFGMTTWSAIPVQLNEIRQIEVVKGPNSAIFGFNAVGGVVNIITYNPMYDNVNVVEAKVGTQNYKEISGVTTVKPNDKVAMKFSGSGMGAKEFDDNRLTGTEADFRVDPKSGKANASMFAKVNEGGMLETEFTYSEATLNEMYPMYVMDKSEYRNYTSKIGYSLESGLGMTDFIAYRNTVEAGLMEDRVDYSKAENSLSVVKLQHLLKPAANHAVRVSAEYRENEMNVSPENRDAHLEYAVTSGGVMWDWALTDKISWMNAGRFDHFTMERTGDLIAHYTNSDYDRTIDRASYNSDVVYKATDVDVIKLGASRGYQLPSIVDFGFSKTVANAPAPGATLYILGNPYMDPAEVTSQELNYQRKIAEINGDAKVSVFHQQTKHLKSTPYAGAGYISAIDAAHYYVEFENIGDSRAYGANLSMSSQVTPELKLTAAYELQTTKDKIPANVTANRYPTDFEHTQPKNSIKVGASYTKGKYEADVFATWQQKYQLMRVTTTTTSISGYELWTIPSHVNMTVRAGYNIDDTTNVSLTGMNVTSSDQVVSSGPEVERRFVLALKKSF